ncbi:tyrosine-type recombinase/integrase [Clostridium sp. JN-1]|uniref:tyrosine-type recombinase/integrase n=1 Tax=Clostridium sp. JN-1 TaxID=2483110 RepID=UPI000F0B366D|nr:tyrosine-type recombinase/integrase [Clostridium sp. JN-1]
MAKRKIKLNHITNLKKVGRTTDNISISEFFDLHEKFMEEKELENLRERTLEEYNVHLKYFKKYVESETQFKQTDMPINSDIFKSYVYYMTFEKKYSPFTVNLRLRTLLAYLRWLYNNNYITENIAIKIHLQKTPDDAKTPLTDVEVKKLLNGCDLNTYTGFRDFSLMLLILDCGIRIGEATELKISDFDLKNGLVTVRADVSKTRVSRQLPICTRTAKVLKELIDIAIEMRSGDYVFQNTYGGYIKKQNLMLSFKKIGKKVGLEHRCSPYLFRHTFATNAVKSGMEIFTLQRIMGHSSILTTRKYIQLETKDLKRNHNKINTVDRYFRK